MHRKSFKETMSRYRFSNKLKTYVVSIIIVILFSICNNPGDYDYKINKDPPTSVSNDGGGDVVLPPRTEKIKSSSNLSEPYTELENELIPFLIFYNKKVIKETELLKSGEDLFILKSDLLDLIKETELPIDLLTSEIDINGLSFLLIKTEFSHKNIDYFVYSDEFKIVAMKRETESADIKYINYSNLSQSSEAFSGEKIEQDKISVISRLNFNQNFSYNKSNREIYGTSVIPNYSLSSNIIANIFDFILQKNNFYSPTKVENSNLNTFNIRKNIESIKATIAAGNLNSTQLNRNGFSQIGQFDGISFYNNPSLDPTSNLSVSVDGSFNLKNFSKVEIINNETVIFSISLNPGKYNIVDIPVSFGEVDQKIKITDQKTGEVSFIELAEGFYSRSTVKPGKYNYSASYGKTRTLDKIEFFSGSIETGLTNNSSISLGARTTFNNPFLDLGLYSDLGFLNYSISASRDFFNKGNAYFFQLSPKKESIFRINLTFNHFDKNYSILGREGGQTELNNSIGVSKAWKLNNNTAISFRLNYSSSLLHDNRLSYSLSYNKSSKYGGFSVTYSDGYNREKLISIGATIKLGKEGSANFLYAENRKRANLSYNGETLKSQLEYNKTHNSDAVSFLGTKNFDLINAGLINNYDVKSKSNNLSFFGSTSLLFSGGRFAISPKNEKNFIIVSSSPEVDFSINGKNKSNIFSNSVYSAHSYRKGMFSVANQTEDESISLINDFFEYRLTEAGGAHVDLKHKKEYSIRGYIITENDIPLSLYAGTMIIHDKPYEIVTDSDGEFEILTPDENLSGAEIRITFSSFPEKVISLKLDEETKQSYDLEEIKFPVILKK